MSRITTEGEHLNIAAKGPAAEYIPKAAALAIPATVGAGGNYTSPLQSAFGLYDFVAGVTSSQAGAITIQRYIDDAGLVALDTGQTTALVGATAAILLIQDGKPCASWTVKITNTGGVTANLTNFALMQNAH